MKIVWIILGLMACTGVIVWSLCRAASEADDRAEEMLKDLEQQDIGEDDTPLFI